MDSACAPNLILNCVQSHTPRVREYVADEYPCAVLDVLDMPRHHDQRAQTNCLMLLDCADPDAMLRDLTVDLTIAWCVSKVYRVDPTAPPLGSLEDCARLLAARLQQLGDGRAEQNAGRPVPVVRVSMWPRSRERGLAELLFQVSEEGRHFDVSPSRCDTVAAAVDCGSRWYAGVTRAVAQVPDMGQKLRHEDNAISRAYFKLREALHRAKVGELTGRFAMDAGAAPGGWTRCLVERGCKRVYAVDPAELSPEVLGQAGAAAGGAAGGAVEHIKMPLSEAAAVLATRQASAEAPPLDVFVSDMILPRRMSATDLFAEPTVRRLFRPGALVVITIKGEAVPCHSQASFDAGCQKIAAEFGKQCERVRVFHLMANKDRERTLVGYLRAEAQESANDDSPALS